MMLMLRLLIVLALLWPASGWPAALVQKVVANTTANGTTIPITVSATGAGNLIVVGVQLIEGNTVSGCTDGTTAFTQATGAQVTLTSSFRIIDVWYLLSSNSGKTIITCTRTGAADTDPRIAWAMEFSGLSSAQFDLAGNVADQTCSGTTCAGKSLATTSTNGVVYGLMLESSGTISAMVGGNEFTFGTTSDWGSADAYLISSTAAAHQPSWVSSSGDTYSAITVAFKAGGGGGATPRTLTLMGVGQ